MRTIADLYQASLKTAIFEEINCRFSSKSDETFS